MVRNRVSETDDAVSESYSLVPLRTGKGARIREADKQNIFNHKGM